MPGWRIHVYPACRVSELPGFGFKSYDSAVAVQDYVGKSFVELAFQGVICIVLV